MAFRRACPQSALEWFKGAYRFEPFGDDWWRTGVEAAAATNANPYLKKGRSAEDFIPKFQRNDRKPMDAEAVFARLVEAFGGPPGFGVG